MATMGSHACQMGQDGRLPKSWILLDNQSTVDVFYNAGLLTGIRKGITRWRLLHQNIHSRYCYKICKNFLQIVGTYTYLFHAYFDALRFICVYFLLSMNLVLQKYVWMCWTLLCVQCSINISSFWLITLYVVYFYHYLDLVVCIYIPHFFDTLPTDVHIFSIYVQYHLTSSITHWLLHCLLCSFHFVDLLPWLYSDTGWHQFTVLSSDATGLMVTGW